MKRNRYKKTKGVNDNSLNTSEITMQGTQNSLWILPDETIIQYIKRLVKLIKWWAVLTFVIGAPASIWGGIQLYDYFIKNDESVILRESINSKVKHIRNTFITERLENDSSIYIDLLKEFEMNVLDYCSLLESTLETKQYKEYLDLPLLELRDLLKKELERERELNRKLVTISNNIADVLFYEVLTDKDNATKISKAKEKDMHLLMSKHSEKDSVLMIGIVENLTVSVANYNKTRSNYRQYLKDAVEGMDEMKKSTERLRTIVSFLQYVIDCNTLFNVSIRHYTKVSPYKQIDELQVSDDDVKIKQLDSLTHYIRKRYPKKVTISN